MLPPLQALDGAPPFPIPVRGNDTRIKVEFGEIVEGDLLSELGVEIRVERKRHLSEDILLHPGERHVHDSPWEKAFICLLVPLQDGKVHDRGLHKLDVPCTMFPEKQDH